MLLARLWKTRLSAKGQSKCLPDVTARHVLFQAVDQHLQSLSAEERFAAHLHFFFGISETVVARTL